MQKVALKFYVCFEICVFILSSDVVACLSKLFLIATSPMLMLSDYLKGIYVRTSFDFENPSQ